MLDVNIYGIAYCCQTEIIKRHSMAIRTTSQTASDNPAGAEEIELQGIEQERDTDEDQGRAINAETALTRSNLLKVLAASVSFFFAGSNDGSLGALTPYILRTYNIGTEYVALM